MAPRRRTLLAAVSTTTAAAAAGCSDLLANETTDGSGQKTPTDVATAFIDDLANQEFERASKRFAERDRTKYGDPARLERLWMAYTAVAGAFDGIDETSKTARSGVVLVDLALSFEGGDHACRVVVDKNKTGRLRNCGIADEYERPTYVDPSAVTKQDLQLEVDGCSLQGTVTSSADGGDAVPGVVFLHDSGPSTRDTTQGGTKAFVDLAEGLATQGLATLRYDKRIPACEIDPGQYTIDQVTGDDALAAIERLRGVDGVDGDSIVVVGHGLGGTAAPKIAARDGNLAGIVGLAAPARPYHELTLAQLEHKISVGSLEWDALADVYDQWADEIDRVRAGDYEPSDTLLGKPGAFWDSLASYDQFQTARDVDVPLCLLQGNRDFQVTVADDLERWQTELEGRSKTTFETYDGLNHLFMPGEGPSVEFAYAVRNNVSEQVVDDLAGWIGEL
ncbi:alpha/beta hydrolase [Natrinema halophilum]|uniref:Alpha/beta hydrolase n=1 Tax=Natrinema halophilum TaxID=1699371 RepID=A0A7D5KSJ9_9EURY|nr:alpha/beta hydrolase [Natrinema halophilum]QLG50377.1 alpha/beta hydrolase [Natrinema halophilum]